MSDKDTGGAAFPCAGLSGLPNGQFIHPEGGMSLRAWFTGQALPAVIRRCYQDNMDGFDSPEEYFAMRAVQCADAAIKELSK